MAFQEDIFIQVETFKVPLYLSLSYDPDFPFSDIGHREHELEAVGTRWGIYSHYPDMGLGGGLTCVQGWLCLFTAHHFCLAALQQASSLYGEDSSFWSSQMGSQ